MGFLHYKGYVGNAEYFEQDKCFVGRVLGLRKAGIIYEGETVEALRKDFEESIDYYLDSCRERGVEPEKPYSGKFVLRLPSELHGLAAEKADAQGISLNEFIKRAVKAAVL
ncbi:MAG: type II toxin-antitoxin system HicB family antitoxin [Bacteroidales bacterium]|nr:type II toxin-antitoxin system HicB family antitoxin [Bacteroidales bacterium]